MNGTEYLQESERTLSDRWNPENVGYREFMNALNNFAAAARRLDTLKRALFYGTEPMVFLWNDVAYTPNDAVDPNFVHAILGVATEAGELVETFLNEPAHPDATNVAEELGDLNWYEAILHRKFNTTPEEVWAANILKLLTRYPEKFTTEAAVNRDLAAEREVLENG